MKDDDEKDTPARLKHPVKASDVQKGHLMAFVYYATVQSAQAGDLTCHSVDAGLGVFGVHGVPLIEGGMSADQYHEEVPTTMTRLAELLVSSVNRPLSVTFVKADGSPRTLRGRLVSAEPLLGRSYCEDLDIDLNDKGGRLRLVDHRTLRSLVVDGVKYTLKGAKA